MKKLSITLSLLACFSLPLEAGSVRIYNADSEDHRLELNCAGSSKALDIKRSATATYTFHSTASNCTIRGGSIDFPTDKIIDGQAWTIRQAKAKKS